MSTHERLDEYLMMAFIIVINILFWGGILGVAGGASYGRYLLYAALLLCAVIVLGSLLVIAFTYFYPKSLNSGVTVRAKIVATFFFMAYFWVGLIVSAVGSFRLISELAAWLAADGFIYWVTFITLALSVVMLAIFAHVLAREHATDCVKKYQESLFDAVDDYNPYNIRERTPYVEEYHEVLVSLVIRGATASNADG